MNNSSKSDHLKASRYYTEPFNEPLETNEPEFDDGLTPFDLLVMVFPVLDKKRIPEFKSLIEKIIKKFPLTKLYPELLELLVELNIEFDVNLIYRSDLYEFSNWLQVFCISNLTSHLPFCNDLQLEIGKFLVDLS